MAECRAPPPWPPKDKTVARFFRYVHHEPNSGCWLWGGSLDGSGYGTFGVATRHSVRAHRFSFALLIGRWPQKHVLHNCDNPPCVNPSHLREGTHAENMRDSAVRKRHQSQGEMAPRAILTESQVISIRLRHKNGEALRPLAREFGVSLYAVFAVVARRNWRHVP